MLPISSTLQYLPERRSKRRVIAQWFILVLLLMNFPSIVFAQGMTFSIIFDDDPGSTVYRDASWGYANGGDYLRLAGAGDKLPLETSQHYSGTMCGVLDYRHATNGMWEMFIASNSWQSRDFSSYDSLVFYVNAPSAIPDNELPRLGLEASNSAKSAIITLSQYLRLDGSTVTWQRVSIPFNAFEPFGSFSLSAFKAIRFLAGGETSAERTLWIDYIGAVKKGAVLPLPTLSDQQLLDSLQYKAFLFFWNEANPSNGLIRDRNTITSSASIAAVGFGLTAIAVAIDHGWITRDAGRDRVLTTLRTFWEKPQGSTPSGTIGYKGWFYHFLDMNTATRLYSPSWKSELSSIDTGLLLAGILFSREYFTGSDSIEVRIRSLADSISNRIDWQWMMDGGSSLTHGYTPENNMLPYRWIGYSEAMILYILGMGSTKNPVPPSAWNAWTSGYSWLTHYGYSHVNFPPLFGHQYSHCWIDFRSIADGYMREKKITYFENSRRATLANRAYCIANPSGFQGYGATIWGLTACDGPTGYNARGAPPAQNDDGTIAPTAAASSMPFVPNESITAMQAMYTLYGPQLWGRYGFGDAFNPTKNWFGSEVIGIDQGPIIIMIENYRTGKVWQTFMKNPQVKLGLSSAGFQPLPTAINEHTRIPQTTMLHQNFPNPFNPSTTIRYTLNDPGQVTLSIFNVMGQLVGRMTHEHYTAGEYQFQWEAMNNPSGIYCYQLQHGVTSLTKRMILLK
ncbi:MAG: glucoamylase family protein [bacterium]